MGRNDRDDKQRKRAREVIERGLARNDLEMALDGLVSIAPEARDEFIPSIAPRLATAVQQAHGRKAWSHLAHLASRADREPRIVNEGGGSAGATWWPLFWACMFGKDFDRAGRIWLQFGAALRASAPDLAAAVEAGLGNRGAPPAELLGGLDLPELPAVDPRLGIESVRVRPTVAAPDNAAGVEPAVLRLYATQRWAVFATTLTTWAQGAVQWSESIWSLAAALSTREILLRAGQADNRAGEPLALLVRAGESVSDPSGVREHIARAFRLALRATVEPGRSDLPRESLARLLPLALRDPELRKSALEALTGLTPVGLAREVEQGLYITALAVESSVDLWLKLAKTCDERARPPDRVQHSLRQAFLALTQATQQWGTRLRGPDAERQAAFRAIVQVIEPADYIEWVDRLWGELDAMGQSELSGLIATTLDRAVRAAGVIGDDDAEDFDDVLEMLGELRALGMGPGVIRREIEDYFRTEFEGTIPRAFLQLIDAAIAGTPMNSRRRPADDATALALWRRFESRLVPIGGAFVRRAFSFARDAADASRIARDLGARAQCIEDWLTIMTAAEVEGFHDAMHVALEDAIARRPGDVRGWARAFEWVTASGLQCMIVPAARAFVDAAASNPALITAQIRIALSAAEAVARPPRPHRSPPGKRTKPPQPKRKTGRAVATPPQLQLSLDPTASPRVETPLDPSGRTEPSGVDASAKKPKRKRADSRDR